MTCITQQSSEASQLQTAAEDKENKLKLLQRRFSDKMNYELSSVLL
jgi:hypothetical protein